MFRAIKRFWLVPALLLWSGYSVFGFSLAGPIGNGGDLWQVPQIGYGLFPPNFNGDVVAPKNLGEQYRWNTKNVYYAYDTSFLTYFGTNGAAQVDAAFAILNSLSNVDAYTPGLSEWPLTSSRINLTAAEVNMYDLKSFVLIEMMEQLGLAEPDRYTFTLHNRIIPAGALCPNYQYVVTERNFDPVSQNYSTYVNGVLYKYSIVEECPFNPNPETPLLATALRAPVDPEQQAEGAFSAVAAGQFGGLQNPNDLDPTLLGRYYLGLTRDDIGGFRYLWSSNTIVTESIEPESLLQVAPPQGSLLITSNLAVLNATALTNDEAALLAIFPFLQITSATNLGFAFILTTNFTTNVTPVLGQPYGTFQTNVVATVTSNSLPTFGYTYGNVITNFTFLNGGVLVTNSPSEYLLVPSNQCGFKILSNALTSVVLTTNPANQVTLFTNHALVVNVFSCVPNAVALREGMEKMNFFRVDFDSLVGTNWSPVTNIYTLTAVTNNQPVTQTLYRVVTQPDILFSASDLAGANGGLSLPEAVSDVRTTPDFNETTVLPGLAGPGIIQPLIHITLNKTGPILVAESPTFLSPLGGLGNTNVSEFQWASFDGTTNAPIAYPVDNDYQNLVNNIFLQITLPGSLPNGNISKAYSLELQASGATGGPYFYSTISGSLPNGLNLVVSGGNTFISGTPTATGIFDFVLQVMDSTGRTSNRNFAIEIDP